MQITASFLELLNSISQLGTFLVVIATAVAGIGQLRHLRASNELEALLRLTEHLREPQLLSAFEYVQVELRVRLAEPAYRDQLTAVGFVDPHEHPEMDVCNWFNEVGALVKNGLIDERVFLDLFDRLVTYYWKELGPVIALLRRNRSDREYENFEYLARLATIWKARHPHGTFPHKVARMPLVDRYLEIDEAREAQPETSV